MLHRLKLIKTEHLYLVLQRLRQKFAMSLMAAQATQDYRPDWAIILLTKQKNKTKNKNNNKKKPQGNSL